MRTLVISLAFLFAVAAPASAASGELSPVLVLQRGHVTQKRERFLGPTELPGSTGGRRATAHAAATKKKAPRGKATRLALDGLLASGQIDQPTRDARQASLRTTLRALQGLNGTRAAELGAVVDNVDAMATSKQLTPSRLNAVFATLEANRTWWT